MAVIGIGVDVVDVDRFERSLAKAPGLIERLFVEGERGLPVESLAARFAAKEAVLKILCSRRMVAAGKSAIGETAFGMASTISWRNVIVHRNENGAPYLEVRGRAAEIAGASGIDRWHISLTHDGGMAMAFVIAESLDDNTARWRGAEFA